MFEAFYVRQCFIENVYIFLLLQLTEIRDALHTTLQILESYWFTKGGKGRIAADRWQGCAYRYAESGVFADF